jgi:hypothetical protein
MDFEGNILWHKCYGGTHNDWSNRILPTPDGGYIVIGETFSNDGDVSGKHNAHGSRSDIWVFKINASGDLLWQKCFGGLGDESLWNGVIDNGDGSYVIASTLTGINSGDMTCVTTPSPNYDIWLIQLRDTTVVSANHLPKPEYAVEVYPNPAGDFVIFELQNANIQATINITDLTGRPFASFPLTGEKTVWDTSGVKPGFYLFRIGNGIAWETGKLLISH